MTGALPAPEELERYAANDAIESGLLFGIPGESGVVAHIYAMMRTCEECYRIVERLIGESREYEIRHGWIYSWERVEIKTNDDGEVYHMIGMHVDTSARPHATIQWPGSKGIEEITPAGWGAGHRVGAN